MSALEILRTAYAEQIAPAHLYGSTQQKTMGARLSENILTLRDQSVFYRTAPGRFFLRDFINDPDIPADLRQPIVARRRQRELPQRRSLALDHNSLSNCFSDGDVMQNSAVLKLIEDGNYHYASSASDRSKTDVIVWSFILVLRDGHILTHRQGAYRERRDAFQHRRTIGFYAPIVDSDLNLFDRADHGIVESGIRTLAADLDLYGPEMYRIMSEGTKLKSFVCAVNHSILDVLSVVGFTCPEWLDPTSKRLAINNLEWLDLSVPINHVEDFDPWSQAVMSEAKNLAQSYR